MSPWPDEACAVPRMTESKTSNCDVVATLSFFPTHRSIVELNPFSAFVSPAGGVGLLRKKQLLSVHNKTRLRFRLTKSIYLMEFFGSSRASEDVREVDRW